MFYQEHSCLINSGSWILVHIQTCCVLITKNNLYNYHWDFIEHQQQSSYCLDTWLFMKMKSWEYSAFLPLKVLHSLISICTHHIFWSTIVKSTLESQFQARKCGPQSYCLGFWGVWEFTPMNLVDIGIYLQCTRQLQAYTCKHFQWEQ